MIKAGNIFVQFHAKHPKAIEETLRIIGQMAKMPHKGFVIVPSSAENAPGGSKVFSIDKEGLDKIYEQLKGKPPSEGTSTLPK